MDAHELEHLAAAPRRSVARQTATDQAGSLTMPAAMINLQRMAGNESVSSLLADERDDERPSPVHDVIGSGSGSAMDGSTRSFLEERMGADFSDVRIHTGPKADESARSINAQAYTVGNEVVFRSGAYDPSSTAGRHVLAHELAHVVQQRSGPVSGTPAAGGISLSDPGDSFERAASATADRVIAGETVAPAASPGGESVTAQRAGDEEEEEAVQALVAQRAEEDEEELPAG